MKVEAKSAKGLKLLGGQKVYLLAAFCLVLEPTTSEESFEERKVLDE